MVAPAGRGGCDAGRVAREKNIDAFIDAPLPGSKVVVGDGPERARLERAHPAVRFLGYRFGEDLSVFRLVIGERF